MLKSAEDWLAKFFSAGAPDTEVIRNSKYSLLPVLLAIKSVLDFSMHRLNWSSLYSLMALYLGFELQAVASAKTANRLRFFIWSPLVVMLLS